MSLTPPIGPDDHAQGPADAPVTLVEYGDFECPHCGRAHPVVEAVRRRLGDQLRFVFRHFPLTEAHPHALHAAEAAEAAAEEGRFWPMHALLFENQDALEDVDLVAYAEEAGADPRRTAATLASDAYEDRVRRDFLSGVRSGVNGTPTFFINGVRHQGPWDQESLLEAIAGAGAARR